jgi:hypothetical protein
MMRMLLQLSASARTSLPVTDVQRILIHQILSCALLHLKTGTSYTYQHNIQSIKEKPLHAQENVRIFADTLRCLLGEVQNPFAFRVFCIGGR